MTDRGTDGEGHLLVREREALARIAHRLTVEGPAFVVLVCPPRLRSAVQAELRSYEHLTALPDVATQETPEAVLEELSTAREFRSMALGAGDETIRATNWHREKLRLEGVTLLWLEGLDALERFRELAPDAYSFRDGLVLVSGVPVFRVETPTEERAELKLARRRYDRAKSSWERLEAGGVYVEQLRVEGRRDDVLKLSRLLRSTLQICLGDATKKTVPLLLAAGRISAGLGDGDAWIDALAVLNSALALPDSTSTPEARASLAILLTVVPDPCSSRRGEAVSKALLMVKDLPLSLRTIAPDVMRMSAVVAMERGRMEEAKQLLEETRRRGRTSFNRMLANADLVEIAAASGYSEGALERVQDAWVEAVRNKHDAANNSLVMVHLRHAELKAARRLLDFPATPWDTTTTHRVLSYQVTLAVLSGETAVVLATLEHLVCSPPPRCDTALYRASADAVRLLREINDTEHLDPSLLQRWDGLLNSAQSYLLSLGDPDPPWYRVLLPALRADLLALRPDRRADALTLYRESWDLARERYPEAAPNVAVRFIDALLAGDELTELPELLDAATKLAVVRERLNDQMALVVRRLLHGVRTGVSLAPLDALRSQLDALFAESGSLVLKGNTLLTLARHLPPTTVAPDALAIVDEARRVFAELAMPHEEALCAERAGEIALARGNRPLARQRFQDALRRRRTYGLALRIPRLERLLASAADDAPSA